MKTISQFCLVAICSLATSAALHAQPVTVVASPAPVVVVRNGARYVQQPQYNYEQRVYARPAVVVQSRPCASVVYAAPVCAAPAVPVYAAPVRTTTVVYASTPAPVYCNNYNYAPAPAPVYYNSYAPAPCPQPVVVAPAVVYRGGYGYDCGGGSRVGGVVAGAAVGAIIGAATTEDPRNTGRNALIGGAIGAVVGDVLSIAGRHH